MGWCPKCGAEYREGVEECSRCATGLVEEQPELPRPRLRERLPPFLLRRCEEVKRALGYAVEAVRVLRRHPSLLLLPLALAVLNEAELAVGSYVVFRHTAMGLEWAEMLRNAPSPPPPPRGVYVRVSSGSVPPAPSVEFTGAGSVLTAVAQGITQGRPTRSVSPRDPTWWLPLIFSLSVAAVVNAVVQAGYYGVALRAVATGIPRWGGFEECARRFSFRLWVFGAALRLVFFVLLGILLTGSDYAVWLSCLWSYRVAVCILALTPFVIVADDASVLAAIKRGVFTLGRNIVVGVLLIGGVVAVEELISRPFDWLWSCGFVQSWPAALGIVSWRSLAVNLPQRGVLACLSAFFVAAAFVWYRGVSAAKG